MSTSKALTDALLPIITRLYEEIRVIETSYGLMAREGDFRPRIEYFHDAVRALTSGTAPYGKDTRLSVERLSYDLQFLRHLKEFPLATMRESGPLSTKTEVAIGQQAVGSRRPDRATREQLSELYGNYAVLFAALLKESADRNHKTRVEDINHTIENLAALTQLLPKLTQGNKGVTEVEHYAHNLEDEELRNFLMQVLQALRGGSQANVKEAIQRIKQMLGLSEKEAQALENAHFNFATAQLACYEDAKSLIKKLAGQGMNLAGKFLQGAVAEAQARGTRGR